MLINVNALCMWCVYEGCVDGVHCVSMVLMVCQMLFVLRQRCSGVPKLHYEHVNNVNDIPRVEKASRMCQWCQYFLIGKSQWFAILVSSVSQLPYPLWPAVNEFVRKLHRHFHFILCIFSQWEDVKNNYKYKAASHKLWRVMWERECMMYRGREKITLIQGNIWKS